jgi:hypothetical protein|tara:strand:- start:82 stop:222 length:141 start_codon:yes stop_codon:yes gene_type:complete
MTADNMEQWLREANRCCNDFSTEEVVQIEVTKKELEEHHQDATDVE